MARHPADESEYTLHLRWAWYGGLGGLRMKSKRGVTDPCRWLRNLTLPKFLLLLWIGTRAGWSADSSVLTNAAQVRQLTRSEAQRGLPVRLQGVIAYWDPGLELLVVQDDTAGVFVRVPASELPLARGQLVSIEGVSAPGDYAPAIERATVRVLGAGTLPEPRPVAIAELASGRFDGQRIVISGIVGEVDEEGGRARLHLHVGNESLNVILRDLLPTQAEALRLVDAEVSLRGVCRNTARLDGRPTRVRLLVPGLDEVTVLRSPELSSLALSAVPIASVSASNTLHRVKVTGEVFQVQTNRALWVRDGTGQIRVSTRQPLLVQLGDVVEVLGFPTRDRGTTYLDHGTARVVAAPLFRTNALSSGGTNGSHRPLPLLQSIADVSRLSPEEAALGYRVRLRGVVTFYDDPWHMLFIRDATNGVFIWPNRSALGLEPGQIVEATGFTSPGDFVTTIVGASVAVQAQGELPAPRNLSYAALMTGREDCQWISIDGIVRSVKVLDDSHVELDVAADGGRFSAMVPGYTNSAVRAFATNLVDAEVRIVGVCCVIPNKRRHAIGFKVFSPGPANVVVTQPAPVDPFALAVSPVKDLFSFGAGGKPGHRVRVRATVTQVRGGNSFFLHDGTGGIEVESGQARAVRPGDRVEVVGFRAIVDRTPSLQNGALRKLGTGPKPNPVEAVVPDALDGRFDGELISTRARLLDTMEISDKRILILQSGGIVFEAVFPDVGPTPDLKRIPAGSLLRLTGIGSTQTDEHGTPRSFRLLVSSPADLQLLRTPPWWELKHALRIGAVLGGIILGTFAWVWLLRKRVREQTATIRQRFETESRLESRYRDLFESATDIVYTTDRDGRITSFNKAAEVLTGYSRAEVVGRNFSEFVAPNHEPLLPTFTEDSNRGGPGFVRELEIVTKSGRHLPVEVNVQPLKENGRIVGAQGIARDITDRKRAEREVHELNASLERRVIERTAELRAANKELEAFSYSVSHDLRAPLRAINGFAEILLKDHAPQLESKARRYLQNVALSGRKMGQLVDDLLAFSRLNRQAVTLAPINLNQMARDIFDELRLQEPARNVAVTLHPLPEGRGDRVLVRQVLLNLLGNAWKFTSKTPNAAIEVGAREEAGGVVYFVRDNGAGFDMQYADKLFGVFQRLHLDDEFPGTGVGLAIVQRIITRHGGRVWAEAWVNAGATFYFTLPGDAPAAVPQHAAPSLEPVRAGHA